MSGQSGSHIDDAMKELDDAITEQDAVPGEVYLFGDTKKELDDAIKEQDAVPV